jgi:hypothetical protein
MGWTGEKSEYRRRQSSGMIDATGRPPSEGLMPPMGTAGPASSVRDHGRYCQHAQTDTTGDPAPGGPREACVLDVARTFPSCNVPVLLTVYQFTLSEITQKGDSGALRRSRCHCRRRFDAGPQKQCRATFHGPTARRMDPQMWFAKASASVRAGGSRRGAARQGWGSDRVRRTKRSVRP